MIIVFYASDVAKFLLEADFKVRNERKIISKIYHKVPIGEAISERGFSRRISMLLLTDVEERQELRDFYQDMSIPLSLQEYEEEELVRLYFKNIYLHLNFNDDCKYRKIKLRSLLKMFGYKRRSEQLVNNIEKTLETLEIKTYLRGNEPCSISTASLDDVIIFKKG